MEGEMVCPGVVRALLFAAFLIILSAPARAADPTGVWRTGDGQARIRIRPCGAAICGTIVWLREPIDPLTKRPHVDDKNADPSKRQRRVMGLRLFEMRPRGDGTWSGPIYNADDGKTYDASITLTGPSNLTVRGCVGPFCGADNWTKSK